MKWLLALLLTVPSLGNAEYFGMGGYPGAGPYGGGYGYPGGFGSAYGGPNSGMGYGGLPPPYGPLGQAYGGIQNPQQRNMALLYSLLAKAKAATYKSDSSYGGKGGEGASAGAKAASEAIGKNLKSFSEGIAKGQSAIVTIKPINEIGISDAFAKLFTKRHEPRRDPLANFSQNLKDMNDQLMQTLNRMSAVQSNLQFSSPDLPKATGSTQPPKKSTMGTPGVARGNPQTTFRGLASLAYETKSQTSVDESPMHRNLHASPEGWHGTRLDHVHDRPLRVISSE